MKRLIAIKPNGNMDTASSRLRAFAPARELAKSGINIEIFDRQSIEDYGVVIFQKAYSSEDLKIAQLLQKKGVLIILDQCDNHFIFNPGNTALLERKERMCKMADLSYAIFASTAEIARLYPEKKSYVLPDYIELTKLSALRKLYLNLRFHHLCKKDKFKLLWFGNEGSQMPRFGMCDIAEKLNLLNKISKQFNIRLTILSNSRRLFNQYFAEKSQFEVNYVEWNKNNYEFLVSQHDICLLPININPFTVCKTGNRLILSLLMGVPVIADEIPSYTEFRDFVRFGNWEKMLPKMLNNCEAEKRRAISGQQYIQRHYSNNKITMQWKAAIEDVQNQYAAL